MKIIDAEHDEILFAQRQEWGGDRFDEVWDGVYVMAPIADVEHQELVSGLTTVLNLAVGWPGLGRVYPGANVTDREHDWTKNYRVPDVLVFLRGNPAQNRQSHWLGGPDLAVEIVSRSDRSREKLGFYAAVGTRELLIVDRDPWALELYRADGGVMGSVAVSTPGSAEALASTVVPLSFRLLPGEARPAIEVRHGDGVQHWVI